SFDLANGESVQPEVKYAVRLIRSSETEQVVVDEKIYEEVLDLKNGETLKKEIEYTAPAYLEGTFQLWLMAQNQSGLDLALSNAGEISLTGNNRYIEVIPESCYLKVEGEAEDVKYSLFQGVDIKSEEKLLAVCELANHFADPVEFTPVIKNYWRSTFGKTVEDDKAPQVSLGLASGEKRSFYFVIPKALTPQAYDAVLELTDKQGKIISNKLSFHYVLRGASATIQNLRLDKDYYQKGETARASIYWTPAADNFYGARFAPTDNGKVFLEIAIKSAAGNLCTEKYDKEADPGARTSDYDLPVTSNCVDPRIIVSIKDGQGNILDQKEYALKSQDVPVGAGLEKEEVQK
ncbi:MAG: hypothetical protein Q8M12_01890, partial [bacterium]|nr:hypothetical protein [bacterium]